jgi:cysteine synthase A
MKANNITELIGKTPHLRINSIFPSDYEVWVKLEKSNPGGSIKDRIALSMVEDAEKNGILKQGSVIIEPTSGNTGVGLAVVAAAKGYEIVLVMPETMTVERRKLMAAYGAKFDLTPGAKGMKGAIARAEELQKEIPNSWIPMQFKNQANPEIHRNTTAREIIEDFPDGIDYLITGVGTGGHITGCAQELKKVWPNIKVFAVEPDTSQVTAGQDPGKHKIQGIGAGFIPDVLDKDVLDGTIAVSSEEAFEMTKLLAVKEGILGGVSSGASFAAVKKKLNDIPKGAKILTFNYDTGERYLSVDGLF